MEINQIYQALANNLETGLNAISKYLKFEVKTSYNYQEPSKNLSVIKGVMNFGNNDVAPVENLDAYTLPAIVSFTCVKEYANEVRAILMKYIDEIRGKVQSAGDYFMVGTYTTPSENEIQLIGQVGESSKLTMFIEFTAYKGLLFSNDIKVTVDGETLLFNRIGIAKRKTCENDNLNNSQTLQSIPLAQSLTFSFEVFLTNNLAFLFDETISLEDLEKEHTLAITANESTKIYKVVMSDSETQGVMGGAMYASLTFNIADGSIGGGQ